MVDPVGDGAIENDDNKSPEQAGADLDNLQKGIMDEVISEREAFFAVEKDATIDSTVTTIGAEVDMAMLGIEVGAEQSKSFDYWVDQLATIETKTIADIEQGTPQERLILEVALQGMMHRLIGSVWAHHMFTLPQQKGKDWKKEGFAIEDTRRKVASRVVDITQLSPTYLDASEQKLLTFLNGSSTLAAGLRNKYPTLLKEEEENMIGMMEYHTYDFLKLPKEEQQKEIGLVGGALQTAKDELGSLTDPAITGKEKAKIIGKYALIAGAGSFVLWWVFKERKEGADGKKEGMSFWKKLLITFGLGGLAYVVLDQIDKKQKKDKPNNKVEDDIDGKDDNVEAVDFANTVPVEEQARATTAADAMNDLFMASPDALGTAGYETLPGGEAVKGLLFGVMQAEYGSVEAATKPYAYFYEYGDASLKKFWDKVKTMPIQWVKSLGNSMLAGMTGNPIEKFAAEKTTDGMVDFLENYAKDTDFIQQLFRKQVSIISYLHYKKKHLEQKLAEEHLEKKYGKERWVAFGEDKKIDLIESFLNDAALYEKYLAKPMGDFNKSPLINLGNNGTSALEILADHSILDASVGPLEREFFKQTQKEMHALVEYDAEDKTSLLTEADNFEGDVLTETGQENISDVVENISEHYDGIGRAGFFRSYLPLLGLFEHDSETEEQLMNMYDGMMAPLVEQLGLWQESIDAGKFTKKDFDQLKKTTAYYTAYFKQMAVSQYAITEMKEAEGGRYVLLENVTSFAGQMGGNVIEGGGKIFNGGMKIFIGDEDRAVVKGALEVGDGLVELLGVVASAAPVVLAAELITYVPRLFINPLLLKKFPRTPLVWKYGVSKPLKRGLRQSGMLTRTGVRRAFNPARMYKNKFKLLKYDLAAGRVSFDRAAEIATKHKFTIETGTGEKIISSGDEMVKTLLGKGMDSEQIEVVKKYRHLKGVRKQILDQDTLGKRWKPGSRSNPDNQIYALKSVDQIENLKKIDGVLSAVTDPTEQKILQRVLADAKDLTKVEILTSKWSTLPMNLGIAPDGTLVSSADDFLKAWKMKPKKFAKLLNKVDDISELPKMMQFVQKAGKGHHIIPGNEARYITNVFKQWKPGIGLEYTDDVMKGLNKLRVVKAVEYVGEQIHMGPRIKQLQEAMKNTKKFLQELRESPRFSFMKKGGGSVNDYNDFIENGGKFLDDMDTTINFTDDVVEHPNAFLRAMNELGAKIKGHIPEAPPAKVTAMMDWMKKHPKITKGIGGLSVVIFGGVNIYFTMQEADSYIGVNQDKVEMYNQKAINEGLLTAGGMALIFIPGVGWVAGLTIAAIEGLTWVANDTFYNVMDAYKTNFNDWKAKGVEAKQEAMQHIMSIMAGEHELERSGSEKFTRLFSERSKGIFSEDADETTRDALRAWILYDEIEKDPTGVTLTTMVGGINFDELEENKKVTPEDAGKVFAATRALKERVAKRVAYIEQKIGSKTTTVTRKKSTLVNTPVGSTRRIDYVDEDIEILDFEQYVVDHGKAGNLNGFFIELLHDSQYATYPDEDEFTPARVDALKEEVAVKVAAQPELQKKLLNLRHTDRQYLLHLVRGSQMYMGIANYSLLEEEMTLAEEHSAYLTNFLSWVSFETGRDGQYALQGTAHTNYDWDLMKTFLLTLDHEQALPTAVTYDTIDKVGAKDDVWMREHMQRSPNVLHNVLYDIATEVYGMKIENSPEVLQNIFQEKMGEKHGVYLYEEGGRMGMTNDGRFDKTTGMSLEEQLTAVKDMRAFIVQQIKDDNLIDTQTGSGEKLINIEIGNKILAIFNRYFNRLWVNEGNQITPNYTGIIFALEQCACDADNQWVQLSAYDISTGMMLGLKDIGAYLFRQNEQGDFEAIRDGKITPVAELYPQLG